MAKEKNINESYLGGLSEPRILWQDRKRVFGLPISATVYLLSDDRLFVRSGILRRKEEQLRLIYVRDLVYTQSLFQKILKLGTIKVISVDRSTPTLYLRNIRDAKLVRELLYMNVQSECSIKNVRYINFNGNRTGGIA